MRIDKRLFTSDCAKLTDVAVRALASKCPRLATLDASGMTGNVSAEALRALNDRLVDVRLDMLRPRAVSGASQIVAGVLTSTLRRLGGGLVVQADELV